MPYLLLFAFIVVPLVELWAIGQVNGVLGLPWTLGLLLLDSVIGALLVRREGAKAWQAFREALGAGRVPGDELLQGVLLLFGGALLLTPGFVTDAVGLALVLPFTRTPLAKLVRLRFMPVPMQVTTGLWNARRDRADVGSDSEAAGSIEVVSVERDRDIDDTGSA